MTEDPHGQKGGGGGEEEALVKNPRGSPMCLDTERLRERERENLGLKTYERKI